MNWDEKHAKQLYDALKMVVTVADRKTVEFDAAHAAIEAAENDPAITRDFAKSQIARLMGLYAFPDNKQAAIKELVDRLMIAPTEDIARQVIDDILDYSTEEPKCPTPGTLKDLVHRKLDDVMGPLCFSVNCRDCGGTGFKDLGRGPRCTCLARRKNEKYIMPVEEVSK